MTVLIAAVAFIVALGPLIIFHELGHFLVARCFGVRVLRFSIGFGRPLFTFQRDKRKTQWVIAAFPLGGYVQMLDEREIDSAKYEESDLRAAFNRQPLHKRAAIIVAGPLANFLVAIVLYWLIGLHGIFEPRPILAAPAAATLAQKAGVRAGDEVKAVDREPIRTMVDLRARILKLAIDHQSANLLLSDQTGASRDVILDLSELPNSDLEDDLLSRIGITLDNPPPVLEAVDPNSAAADAGLLPGDRILAVDGKPSLRWSDFVAAIQAAPGKTLSLDIRRSGQVLRREVTPTLKTKTDSKTAGGGKAVGVIGVKLASYPGVFVHYGPLAAAGHAVSQTWNTTTFSLKMLGKMITGQISLRNLSGPVTIADYAGQSARLGVLAFVTFIAFISISIGLMNLLPIPMLDGGHLLLLLLYYFVEIVKGRPPSERFLEISQRAGMAVLAGLMSLALFNDFSRLLF